MTPSLERVKVAIDFCEMVEEIGMSDDTVIPVWSIDTTMANTHPLTVGMIKTMLAALEVVEFQQKAQQTADYLIQRPMIEEKLNVSDAEHIIVNAITESVNGFYGISLQELETIRTALQRPALDGDLIQTLEYVLRDPANKLGSVTKCQIECAISKAHANDKECKICEGNGRIECEPDSNYSHPCDTCRPDANKEYQKGVEFGKSLTDDDLVKAMNSARGQLALVIPRITMIIRTGRFQKSMLETIIVDIQDAVLILHRALLEARKGK